MAATVPLMSGMVFWETLGIANPILLAATREKAVQVTAFVDLYRVKGRTGTKGGDR